MKSTIHASFSCKNDGVRAAEALLHRGLPPEDVSLILADTTGDNLLPNEVRGSHRVTSSAFAHPEVPMPPQLPPLPARDTPKYYGNEDLMASGGKGYTYDALGAVIADTIRPHHIVSHPISTQDVVIGTEQGVGVGLGLGLLTAMCVPGIGMIAGSGNIVTGLITAGAFAGGIAGGMYGWLVSSGVSPEEALAMSDHIQAGGTTLSVATSAQYDEHEIKGIIENFGGRIIE